MEFSWGSVKLYNVNDVGYSTGDTVYFVDDADWIGRGFEFGNFGNYGLVEDYRNTSVGGTYLGSDEQSLKGHPDYPETQYHSCTVDYLLTLGYEGREIELFDRFVEGVMSDSGCLVLDGELRLLFRLWKSCLEYRNYRQGATELIYRGIEFSYYGEPREPIDVWISYIQDAYGKLSYLYGAEKFESMLDEVDVFLMEEHGYDSRLFE